MSSVFVTRLVCATTSTDVCNHLDWQHAPSSFMFDQPIIHFCGRRYHHRPSKEVSTKATTPYQIGPLENLQREKQNNEILLHLLLVSVRSSWSSGVDDNNNNNSTSSCHNKNNSPSRSVVVLYQNGFSFRRQSPRLGGIGRHSNQSCACIGTRPRDGLWMANYYYYDF